MSLDPVTEARIAVAAERSAAEAPDPSPRMLAKLRDLLQPATPEEAERERRRTEEFARMITPLVEKADPPLDPDERQALARLIWAQVRDDAETSSGGGRS